MANQDRMIAKIGKVQVYRRGGDTCFLKWYDGTRGKNGNYRRRSTKTTELSRAVALATALHEALESGIENPEKAALGASILEASMAHPATRREQDKYPGDHKRHMDALKDYVKFSKSPLLRDLTVEKTTAWAESLEEQGFAFDTRRHMLVALRRASQMGPNFGLRDALNGLRIDRREEPLEVKALNLDALKELIEHVSNKEDNRWSAAIALLGLAGLRPSELVRLRVGDLKDGVLHVGANGAKNQASQRRLPMPKIVERLIAPMLENKTKDQPMIPISANEQSALSILSRNVRTAIDRAGFDLPCKCLRKSFATVCVNDLTVKPELVEAFIGHSLSGTKAVTRRHYLAKVGADKLRPVASAIDEAFGA